MSASFSFQISGSHFSTYRGCQRWETSEGMTGSSMKSISLATSVFQKPAVAFFALDFHTERVPLPVLENGADASFVCGGLNEIIRLLD